MVLLMPNSMSLTLPNVIQIACQAYQRPTERIPKLVHSVNPNGQGSDVSMLSAKLIFFGNVVGLEGRVLNNRRSSCGMLIVRAATTKEKRKKHYPGESKGFVEEMRFVAMRLHTKDTAKEGEKEPDAQPVGAWEPSIEGYLKFLVDSKLVYDTLETIVEKAPRPACG